MGSSQKLLDEYFVPIEGYEAYEVSNYGRVVTSQLGSELRQVTNDEGLLYVVLVQNGSQSEHLVHRLVAQAFFADYTKESDVEFINGNQQDCCIRNLTLKPKG